MAGGKVSAHYIILDVQSMEANGDNLQVKLVAADAIERTSNGLRIKVAGIADSHLAGNIAFAKLADSAVIARLDQAETITAQWDFPAGTPPTIGGKVVSTKEYVDAVAQGLEKKTTVRVTSQAIAELAAYTFTAGEWVDVATAPTFDGVTLADGQKVLIRHGDVSLADPSNGVFVYNATAEKLIRDSEWDTWDDYVNGFAFVEEGANCAGNGYTCTVDQGGTLNTTNIQWEQFSSAGVIEPGNGLGKVGNVLNVLPAELKQGGNAEIDGDQLDIDISLSNITPNTTPAEVNDAKQLGAILKGIDDAIGGIGQTKPYAFTVTATDVTNRYKDLPDTPKTPARVLVIIKGAGGLYYGDDYQMDGTVTNRLTWAGLGMDGIIRSGDKVTVYYDI